MQITHFVNYRILYTVSESFAFPLIRIFGGVLS